MTTDNNEQNCNDSKCPCKKCVFLCGIPNLLSIKNKYIWFVFGGILLLSFLWQFTGILSDSQKNQYEVLNVIFSGFAFAAVIVNLIFQETRFNEQQKTNKDTFHINYILKLIESYNNIETNVEFRCKKVDNKPSFKHIFNNIKFNNINTTTIRNNINKIENTNTTKIISGHELISEAIDYTHQYLIILNNYESNKSEENYKNTLKTLTEQLFAIYQPLLPLASQFALIMNYLYHKTSLERDEKLNLICFIYTSQNHKTIKITSLLTWRY